MGAGDRIHDSFTFANVGVDIKEIETNVFEISGSVEKITDKKIKEEFEIDEDINHVVAIKLQSNGKVVDKEKVKIKVDGVRVYDAEHFNSSDHTFIILEAVNSGVVSINVSWNGVDYYDYIVKFSNDIVLK